MITLNKKLLQYQDAGKSIKSNKSNHHLPIPMNHHETFSSGHNAPNHHRQLSSTSQEPSTPPKHHYDSPFDSDSPPNHNRATREDRTQQGKQKEERGQHKVKKHLSIEQSINRRRKLWQLICKKEIPRVVLLLVLVSVSLAVCISLAACTCLYLSCCLYLFLSLLLLVLVCISLAACTCLYLSCCLYLSLFLLLFSSVFIIFYLAVRFFAPLAPSYFFYPL